MKTRWVNKKNIVLLFLCLLNLFVAYAQQGRDTTLIIYFDNNKYELDRSARALLDSFFSSTVGAHPNTIAGYTDSVGSFGANLILSAKRSQQTINYLKKFFPAAAGYSVKNFGEAHPASKTDNALNRRVEIGITLDKKLVDSSAIPGQQGLIKKMVLDKLYFKPDLPVLESFSLDYLKSIAAVLKSYNNATFEIRGHVNCPLNVPANSSFMQAMNKLSEDRAKTVFMILKDNGIPESKMTYKGMGNTQMIHPYANTDEEKRENMRVEIFIRNN